MIIKFLARGTGSAAAAADYLTREQNLAPEQDQDQDQDRDPEKNPEEVKVLRGNPYQVADVADALQFEHKYTSGVIAWAPEDKPSDAQIGRVVDEFEKTAWAGLEPDRYAWAAVQHREAGGGVHVHVLAARCDLETGKSLNIAAPGWQKTFDALRDWQNHENGWSRPDDPERARDDSSKWSLSYTNPFLKKRLEVAPNVTKAEYYIDTDPGFGNGVDVPITAGIDITKDFVVNLSGVTDGLHVLFVRARDDSSNWSLSYTSPFLKKRLEVAPNVTKAEYYIDTDPGFGNGVDISIAAGVDITKDFVVDLSGTGDGLHVLFVRARDNSSNWSLSYTSPFLKKRLDVEPKVTKAEYYIDTDPGFGAGVDIPITAGVDITKDFVVDLSGTGDGLHVLFVRARDDSSNWSLSYTSPFLKKRLDVAPNITAVEYYFSRPSARTQSFTYSNFAPAIDVEVNFTAVLSILGIDSTYNMHIHATDENGLSSLQHIHPFTVEFINNPPVAVNDTVTTPEDTTITIFVLVNDFDIDEDTIKVQSLDTTGTVGTVVIDPGDSTVTYTPRQISTVQTRSNTWL